MLYRFEISLAIPSDVYDAIPSAKKIAFRDMVREMKAKAIKINEGKDNEEATIIAKWHRCRHDEGKACDETQDI